MKNIFNAPEFEYLKGKVNATPEGQKVAEMEYKRTKLSIDLLNAVVCNDYDSFTCCQKGSNKLTREGFNEIRNFTLNTIKTKDDYYALQTYLLINDLGKVCSFVEKIEKDYHFTSIDHDEILYEGLKRNPSLSPTFESLDKKYQDYLLIGLKTKFNMGQYVQSENLASDLEPLKNLDETSKNYYMLHILYDVAGATGHVNPNGSLIVNQSYWENFKSANKTIDDFINGKTTSTQCYDNYIKERSEMLDLKINSKQDYAVTKLCNLMRVSNKEEAKHIKEIFNSQPQKIKNILINEMTRNGVTEKGILLYYAPATLSNALKYFQNNNSQDPTRDALNIVLPLFASIYKETRNIKNSTNSNSNSSVFLSSVAEACKDPLSLKNYNFKLEQKGNDFNLNCIKKTDEKTYL
ncbi:MAG: hypothetical protein IJW82_02480 [Clostridia bacterium]|nr:hypothetical protein [Clostridia bacterium]